MQQSVEDRGCDHGVVEDPRPLLKLPVGCDNDSLPFVRLVNDLEKVDLGGLVQSEEPHFVDDEPVRLAVALQFAFEIAIRQR